ncbi:hypothetical protein LINPERPRIM_LOCUS24900 [Linum perenne]
MMTEDEEVVYVFFISVDVLEILDSFRLENVFAL